MPAPPTDLERSLPAPLPADPFPTFRAWHDEAHRLAAQPNPNAMVVATEDGGQPSARVVLCRGIEPDPGFLVFFSNRTSQKGREIAATPRAALLFHWDHLDLQARVQGPVVESPAAESDDYWAKRRQGSKIAAWASDQSAPVASRDELVRRFHETCERFGVDPAEAEHTTVEIPRPPHWGGYRVYAERFELWCGSPIRFHDRGVWTRELAPAADGFFTPGPWATTRLQP